MAGAAAALVGHAYVGERSSLVYGLVALNAQEVGRSLDLVIDLPPRPDVPLMIGVAELANKSQVRSLRSADLVAFLAVVHVRVVLASSCFGPHAVTLKAGRMALLYGQLILAGVRLFDSLMTVGAPGGLAGRELGGRKLRRPRCNRLELEAFGQRLSVRHVRKVYPEVASEERVKTVGLLLEVEQAGRRF